MISCSLLPWLDHFRNSLEYCNTQHIYTRQYVRVLFDSPTCFVSFLLCCVFYCCPVSAGVSPDFFFFPFSFSFPLPFAFRKTTHRVRRGQTSLWNNNGVVLGKLPMERPVRKKKKKKKKRKFGLVSDPSRKHSSGRSCCSDGSSPIEAPMHSLAGSLCCCQDFLSWGQEAEAHGLEKQLFICFIFKTDLQPWLCFPDLDYLMLHTCFEISSSFQS